MDGEYLLRPDWFVFKPNEVQQWLAKCRLGKLEETERLTSLVIQQLALADLSQAVAQD